MTHETSEMKTQRYPSKTVSVVRCDEQLSGCDSCSWMKRGYDLVLMDQEKDMLTHTHLGYSA